MPSKAQGLSLNTIIIAAIVLIVLLLLVGLLTGFFGGWKPKFNALSSTSCSGSGGKVLDSSATCPIRTKDSTGFYEDVKDNQKCCLPQSCGESVSGYDTYCTSANVCKDAGSFTLDDLTGCRSGQVCCVRV